MLRLFSSPVDAIVHGEKKKYFDTSVRCDADHAMPLWYRMNHWIKKEANVYPSQCPRGVVWFAKRNIVAGEELMWDYDPLKVLKFK